MKFKNSRSGGQKVIFIGSDGKPVNKVSDNVVQSLDQSRGVSPQDQIDYARLNGGVVINEAGRAPVGGVSQVVGESVFPQSLTLVFDNTGNPDTVFRIGTDLGATLLGIQALPVATSGSNDVPAIYESFRDDPILIGEIHAETDITPRQLREPMLYYPGGNVDGTSRGNQRIPLQLAPRPTYQNDQLLILNAVDNPWRVGSKEQITWNILAGETPTITFQIRVLKA